MLDDKVYQREKLLETIDDVAVLIKAQQSLEGGILAGHYFHLAYVRDQYGASRCLLKLGYLDEVKKVLEFYWISNIAEIWGKLHVNTYHKRNSIGLHNII